MDLKLAMVLVCAFGFAQARTSRSRRDLTESNGECGACILIYLPVCGSDGKTYDNECAFDCAQSKQKSLTIVNRGECDNKRKRRNVEEDDCPCGFILLPVCGSDGKTYPNECALDCEKSHQKSLAKLHDGECKKQQRRSVEPEDCVCGYIYLPVCGSDGKTYGNECSLNCKKREQRSLSIQHRGSCETKSQ